MPRERFRCRHGEYYDGVLLLWLSTILSAASSLQISTSAFANLFLHMPKHQRPSKFSIMRFPLSVCRFMSTGKPTSITLSQP
jgi:hypothetical protein